MSIPVRIKCMSHDLYFLHGWGEKCTLLPAQLEFVEKAFKDMDLAQDILMKASDESIFGEE